MIPYILHSAILLAACLIFYKLLIEKETYFRLNRGILLLFMGAILMLPLVSIPAQWSFVYEGPELLQEFPTSQPRVPIEPTPILSEVPLADVSPVVTPTVPSPAPIASVEPVNPHPHLFEMASESHFSWIQLLQLIYGAGVLVFGLSLMAQLVSLGLATLRAPKRREGKYTFIELPDNKSPFSFGNYIFLGKDIQNREEVLAHERIHVDQGHTLDIILAELLFVFQWFNPFAWIFKKTVKQNLEFLTDQEMLTQGFDSKSYQISLVKVSAPNHTYSITANYNQSLLKKRILMMHAKRSSIQSGWKYLALFPMLALSTSFLNAVYLSPEVDVAEAIVVPSEAPIPAVEEVVDQRLPEHVMVAETPIVPTSEQEEPARINGESFIPLLSNNGTWKGRIKEREFCITLIQGEEKQYHYMYNECYSLNKFPSVKALGNTAVNIHEFSLEKEEGTIFFEGSFNQGTGEGSWVFESSSAYRDKLESMGIAGIGDEFMFRLFLTDDNSKYIENAKELQGLGLSSKLLEDFMTHMAPADLAKEYQNAGLDLEETHDFLYSRVKASDLVEYREAGLSWSEHEEFIHSRVNADFLKKYMAAGLDLEENEEYIHSRVNPDFLKKYMDSGLDLEEHEEYIHSRVNPDFLKKYMNSGLDLDEHEEYIHSRVDPDFLKKYMAAGLNLDDHEGYIHSRVNPDFLKKYMDSGLDLEEHEEYIHSRVDPDFLKKYMAAGLDLDEHEGYIHSRVDPDFLKKYMDSGLDLDDHEGYIHSRVDPDFLKKYMDSGLDLDDHEGYIHSRVDPDFLKKYMDSGLDLDDHEGYIHSRVDPDFLKKYMAAGFDLDDYEGYIHSRVNPDFLRKYQDAGFDLEKYESFIHSRVDPDFLLKYKDAGLDPHKYEEFIHRRMDPEDILKIREEN